MNQWQAQALLAKAKEMMASGNAGQDVKSLLKWGKEASKEELIETVKNRVRFATTYCRHGADGSHVGLLTACCGWYTWAPGVGVSVGPASRDRGAANRGSEGQDVR